MHTPIRLGYYCTVLYSILSYKLPVHPSYALLVGGGTARHKTTRSTAINKYQKPIQDETNRPQVQTKIKQAIVFF